MINPQIRGCELESSEIYKTVNSILQLSNTLQIKQFEISESQKHFGFKKSKNTIYQTIQIYILQWSFESTHHKYSNKNLKIRCFWSVFHPLYQT